MARRPADPLRHGDRFRRGLGQLRRLRPAIFQLRRKELFPDNARELLRLALYFLVAVMVPVILWQLYQWLFKPMFHSGISGFAKSMLWMSLGAFIYLGSMIWYALWQSWLRRR